MMSISRLVGLTEEIGIEKDGVAWMRPSWLLKLMVSSMPKPRISFGRENKRIVSSPTQSAPSFESFIAFGHAHEYPFELLEIKHKWEHAPLSFAQRSFGSFLGTPGCRDGWTTRISEGCPVVIRSTT